MTNIFMDSGPFRAMHNPRDEYIDRVEEILKKLEEEFFRLWTTDYVIDETYTGLLTKAGYDYAMEFDRTLARGNIKIERITPGRFATAQGVFRRYNKDKKWSFTDCASLVVMKELKIKKVFTFDQNFAEMGFEVL